MSCPDDGVLRAAIDADPAAGSHEHITSCPSCHERTAELRRTAEVVAPALALIAPARLPTVAETEAALGDVRSRAATSSGPAVVPMPPPRRERLSTRMRRPVTAAAAAALVFSVVGTPAGRSAASDFLAQFRSERFAPISVNDADAAALGQLEHLGTVSGDLADVQPEPVDSISAASSRVGFTVAAPDPGRLPAGVRRTPEVLVTSPREVRFTFDAEMAARWVQDHGGRGAGVPERFDGASLVVSVPAVVALQYAAADGSPGLIIGQARQVEARAEGGVSFEELRRFLLDLPGLSPSTRAQLAAIDDWKTTLPLPIPAGQVQWKRTSVAGADGLLLGDNTGLGSALIWQRDGRIYGVAGPVSAKVVRDVAVSLH